MRLQTPNKPYAPMFQRYTVRANRGKARIWLEGGRLDWAKFTVGARFNLDPITDDRDDSVLLRLRLADDGARKVSGKGERPIVDLSGGSCAPFTTGDDVLIEYHPSGLVLIKGA